jgi:hypothetical protein
MEEVCEGHYQSREETKDLRCDETDSEVPEGDATEQDYNS